VGRPFRRAAGFAADFSGWPRPFPIDVVLPVEQGGNNRFSGQNILVDRK
jgi:hypothetical protein